MHEIKFRKRRHVAQGLGRLWARTLTTANNNATSPLPSDTILIPLPMHLKKRRERGFDQAAVMAKALSEATGLPLAKILERIHDTPPQSGLHPQQRIENVIGAFRLKPGSTVADKNIILVDDIYTTGASLNECARVLKSAGASNVYAMTLAIAIRKQDTQD